MGNSGKSGVSKNGINAGGVAETLLESMYRVKDFVVSNNVEPWSVGRLTAAPCNGLTGVCYDGFYNKMQLMLASMLHGYSDSRFVPMGALIKLSKKVERGLDWRGAKSVALWRPVMVRVSAEQSSLEGSDDSFEEDSEDERRLIFRQFRALNVSDIRGDIEDALVNAAGFDWMSDDLEARAEEYRDALLARFPEPPAFRTVANLECPSYSVKKHRISMPPFADYYSLEHYLRDLTHELSHATQAVLGRRLDEKLCARKSYNESYASEELAAHFATVSVMLDYGLVCDEKREASYILGWYKALERNEGLLKSALLDAASIVRFFASK